MDTITHKLGGKDREFRFDMKALARWSRSEGKDLSNMTTILDGIDMIGFAGLCYYAHVSAVGNIDESPDDAIDWFDDDFDAFIEMFSKAGSQLNLLFGGEEDDAKKKRPTKTKVAKARPSTK